MLFTCKHFKCLHVNNMQSSHWSTLLNFILLLTGPDILFIKLGIMIQLQSPNCMHEYSLLISLSTPSGDLYHCLYSYHS